MMADIEAEQKDKGYEIVVNGELREVHSETLTYEQIVALAFSTPTPGAIYTVTFRGAKDPKEGSLKPDHSVEIKKQGTIFNVTATVKS
jgi:hypothetical protein